MKRRYDYDVLRVCSMFGVIYLHVASGALRSLNYPVLWNVSNIFACIATPAGPLLYGGYCRFDETGRIERMRALL